VTDVKDGFGMRVFYNEDGLVMDVKSYKDGEIVKD
jgi:hypothetical protein